MASIERTAYPRFKRQVSARELHDIYTASPDEIDWARGLTRSDQHLLTLTVLLKCFQRLGYFPRLEDVPRAVVEHVRDGLGLAEEVPISRDADRTTRYHKRLVRDQLGVTAEPERARTIAEETIRSAAAVKDNPADLINVALEELIRARCELPAYSTLGRLAGGIPLDPTLWSADRFEDFCSARRELLAQALNEMLGLHVDAGSQEPLGSDELPEPELGAWAEGELEAAS